MTCRLYLALFLLSAAALTFEINLTRLFSVAQFYHFAFMVVSIALLGFAASGSALAIFAAIARRGPRRSLGGLGLATALSILISYLLTNWVPFDSFSIAWDRRQIAILVLHYLALATPFFFSGMAVGLLLALYPQAAGRTYAANLLGSALGAALALLIPSLLGGEGTVVLSSALAALASLLCMERNRLLPVSFTLLSSSSILLLLTLLTAGIPLPFLDLRLSPYKGLSYVLRYPDAQTLYRRWNSFSRVDLVRSASIHSIPGLSFRYLDPLPSPDGLFVDGNDLSPTLPADADATFADYLPMAVAQHLRPAAGVLILEPRGGLDVFTALALGAEQVTVVEVNPLIVDAARPLYDDPRLQVIVESDRSYLRRSAEQYDIIVLSLTASYHPVRSGAYSLAEDYRYTVEAFEDALARLEPGGLLVVTRWLQNPPSEELRAFALAVTALETTGGDPAAQIVAFRGYQTGTLLIRNGPFRGDELALVREFLAGRAFDPIYMPGIRPEETNRYNVLPDPVYYQTFTNLLAAQPRQVFYDYYPYEVSPPSDNHPFFGHYFKWSQAPQVLAELGRTWQPFGGAGYFVVVALLILALVMAGTIIFLPLAIRQFSAGVHRPSPLVRPLIYFSLIGLAFLLVEIPLIQRFILYLGSPAYAFTSVVFTLLLFSGLGSRLSERIPLRLGLPALLLSVLVTPMLLPGLFDLTLGLPLAARLGITLLALAPTGFLMGIPFPGGIRRMRADDQSSSIPLIWAANGAASVVASVLAALLALTFGFSWVLRLGALCYAAAWLTGLARPRPARPPHPSR